MAEPVYKVVEVVGTSEESVSKAIDPRHSQSRPDVASTWLVGGPADSRRQHRGQ